MRSRGVTIRQQNRETQNTDLTKPEEEVRTEDGRRIRNSGSGSNIVSSMGRRRVTRLEIAQMPKKLRRGSGTGLLRSLRRRSFNRGR